MKSALPGAFDNTPLTTSPLQDGDYVGRLRHISLGSSSKSQAVFVSALLDIPDSGDDTINDSRWWIDSESVEAKWWLLKKTGEANEFGIMFFRKSMQVLGYRETLRERFDERNLAQVFSELIDEKPWLKFRVATRGEWTNVNFIRLAEPPT